MLVLVKHPGQAPFRANIGRGFKSIQKIIGGYFEQCISGQSVIVYCDEDGLSKGLLFNLVRPSDGSPIFGTVLVVGTEGGDERDLDDRETALWLATLSLVGVDPDSSWRAAALGEFAPLVHTEDREMYEALARKIGR